jgi:uncharacterized protein Yka (UPF0111/DUF47 family)
MNFWKKELTNDEQVAALFREQIELCSKCIPELARFLEGEADQKLLDKIVDDEHRGDILVPKIRKLLDRSRYGFELFSREDVFALAQKLDDVVDYSRQAASVANRLKCEVSGMKPVAKEFCRIIGSQLMLLEPRIAVLPEFNARLTKEVLDGLDALETEGDRLRIKGEDDLEEWSLHAAKNPPRQPGKKGRISHGESSGHTVAVVWATKRWLKILGDLEKITDSCFIAGKILLSMARKDRVDDDVP